MTVQSFVDIEDFLRTEEIAQTLAGQKIKPWHREIGPGDFFMSVAEIPGHAPLPVFSKVVVPDVEPVEEDEEPLEEEPAHPDYVFTKSFSVFCPEGELGDVHRSVIFRKLSKEEFESFSKKWPTDLTAVLEILSAN